MTKTCCQIVQRLLAVGVIAVLAGRCFAAPVLDASNDVGGSSATLGLMPNNFWAQSFTVTADGLLSQVDVQVGKFAGAAGDVRFELRPLVDGLPTTDDSGTLFISSIDINNIPVIDSLADPPPFVSVDVSSAGIHAQPGDQYAISLRRSGGTPVAAWRSQPNSYPDGVGFFRPLLNVPWSPSVEELGFQTWIDSTPSAPYKLRVDATFDVQYRPGTVSTLIEGEEELYVGGFPGFEDFPEQRPMMEFPLADLPAGAVIEGAHLELDFFVSSGEPRIEIIGFAGDGLASFDDTTTTGTLLAITEPTNASSPNELPIDASFIASLMGQTSHLGVRMRSLDLPEYVGFNTTEEDFPTVLPPRLVIEYTLPQVVGDSNGDGKVDGLDYLVWAENYGDDPSDDPPGAPGNGDFNDDGVVDGLDYVAWATNYGQGPNDGVALPEPGACVLLVMGVVMLFSCRRRRAT